MSTGGGAILLMGPTAAGKTGLSIALAQALAARGQPAEIISVDSAQVYRGMDIGTAKPDLTERAGIAHHLIDVCDPTEPYSAARFRDDALALVARIRARGHLPLLVGGTMLYFRALTRGLDELPAADAGLRARLAADARELGWPALHARLATLDPVTAQRLHPNDSQRIQRALEVVLHSGRPLSELYGRRGGSVAGLAFLKLALNPGTRAQLHARIAMRWQHMLGQGLLREVSALHRRGDLHEGLPSIRAVGYRQLWGHLQGEASLAQAQEQGLAATRQFAKRQITWLRSEHDLCWMNSDAPDNVDTALKRIDGWLSETSC